MNEPITEAVQRQLPVIKISYQQPSQKAQETLKALTAAVRKELEKKRRLGQYAVFWSNGRPVAVGDDAPSTIDQL